MRKLPEIVIYTKEAKKQGFPVVGGTNGGGWCRLAHACGITFPPATKEGSKRFLREKFGDASALLVNVVVAPPRKQSTQQKKAARLVREAKKSGPVTIIKARSLPVVTMDGVCVMTDAFLATFEWRRVRMMALKKYGPVCQCCGATPANGAVMNVDHIKPRKVFPHLALDVNNLQILCHECNHGKGNWDMTDWRTAPEDHVTDLDEEARRHLRSI